MAPKILLFGSGAIGTIYVYLLQKAGCEVVAVCRSNYEAAKKDGFHINSAIYGDGLHIQPDVVRTPQEAADNHGEFDYILVCSKAMPNLKPSTPEIIRPAVTKKRTCIVLIQNGVGIEDEYADAFPENPLLSCVVYLPTTQISPGHIEMGNFENLEIGTYPQSATQQPAWRQAAETLEQTLQKGGGNAKVYQDIQAQRWSKLVLNAAWNPICALTMCRDVAYLQSSDLATPYIREVMGEVVDIAQALGYKAINTELAEFQFKRATDRLGTKGIEPSMLVDVLNGRRMEVEVILGNTVKIGKEHGVSVIRLEGLYALAKALDESIAYRKPGESLAGDSPGSK